MATVNFLYRSTRPEAPLILRLLFAHNGKDYVIGAKTRKIVSSDYWKNDHNKQRINDIDKANFQREIKQHNNDLQNHILDAFLNVDDPAIINKDWLKETVNEFYTPKEKKQEAPKHLTDFFVFYSDIKANELTKNRKKKLTVVRNKLLRFEEYTGKKLLISDINDFFKNEFISYCKTEQYAKTTIQGDFSIIKTVCLYAKEWNIKTNPQLRNLRIKNEPTKHPYLNFDELEAIRKFEFPKGSYLDNARDWLLISCYTGQRISDFLRFTPEMVIKKKGKYFLHFTQTKTKKLITIPFLKEAKEVFDKYGGNFPRSISHQKYNDYIKEVCELAGITEPTKGKIQICIAENPDKATRNDYRREIKTVPKYKLVSSHIGRRSFATNFYGKVPTSYLINITGHSTEKMFLNYIQKNETDTAFDAFKYFE